MIGARPDEGVGAAFALLLGELDKELERNAERGKAAFEVRDYTRIERAQNQLRAIEDVQRRVRALRQEWLALVSGRRLSAVAPRPPQAPQRRSFGPKLPRGARTPEVSFQRPILEALMAFGGRATDKDVLAYVAQQMREVLRPVDFERLSSKGHGERWQNTARWMRQHLKEQGLLRADSPRGTWEISDEGRRWLAQQG